MIQETAGGVKPGERTGASAQYAHLDFVRSVAVLLVFGGHLSHTLGQDRGTGSAAHSGVLMFFVHTCLVLFLSRAGLRRKAATCFSVSMCADYSESTP